MATCTWSHPVASALEWFSERMLRPAESPGATINGEAVDVEAALARAAELLRGARRPLLHGFDHATVEDARAAVALADRLGALVETDEGEWPGAPAVPLRGASTATLGEIRDRSRLVVIWREDPETTHPRLLDRLGFGGDDGANARGRRRRGYRDGPARRRTARLAGVTTTSTRSSACTCCSAASASRRASSGRKPRACSSACERSRMSRSCTERA